MKYFLPYREIHRGNSRRVDELCIYSKIFKTEEEARDSIRHEQEQDAKRYGYDIATCQPVPCSLEYRLSRRADKYITYRHIYWYKEVEVAE